MKKTRLDVERLAVDSFPTSGEQNEPPRGTVHGQQEEDAPCTHWRSCLCPTAYYHCGDGYHTLYSCDYTRAAPCFGSGMDCA